MFPDSSLGPADYEAEKARGRPIPTAEYNLLENGATSDGVYNTWRWSSARQKQLGRGKTPEIVSPDTADPLGKRLDYIFAGSGGDREAPDNGKWVVKRVAVGMLDRHPELGCSLSDHFSVEATLSFQAAKPGHSNSRRRSASPKEISYPTGKDNLHPPDDEYDTHLQNGTYLQSPGPSEGRSSHELDDQRDALSTTRDRDSLPRQAYDEILAMIHKYTAREQRQRRWRAAHFYSWLAIAVGCLVAVWFVGPRPWASFVLMLASTLGLAAGTVDGLIALLFFGAELRALKEFEWEVMNAKAAAAGGGAPLVEDPPQEQVEDW
jgi:sphingomyelin phosphodiesterase 2